MKSLLNSFGFGGESSIMNTLNTISNEEITNDQDSTEQVLQQISNESSSLTDILMNYKEIKWIYEKTGIHPIYLVYFFTFLSIIILINYFSNAITLLFGVVYPIRQSMHELRTRNKEGIRKSMQYWVVFFLFLNLETLIGKFLTQIPMYLFYKMVFLSVCFIPSLDGADYFYNAFLRPPFQAYERQLYRMTLKFTRRLTKTMYCDE